MTAVIKVQNLTKRFGSKLAVDDISFEVPSGKVTGFLGPNGAGKSTTMFLMLGLDYGRGHTTYSGKKLQEYKQPSKIVGVLLEAKAFHPTRTARRHLRILAAEGNIPDKRVDEVLDIVGLKGAAKQKPARFSLGMSQRLGIAAAILGEPKYLLLDEPANGLDPEGIAWLRSFIKDYAARGSTVFVSSHILSEISQMADNLVVIGKGKLLADMPTDDFISGSSYSSVFVRVSNMADMQKALNRVQIDYKIKDNGLHIKGVKTDDIGKLAHKSDIAILELAQQNASLEEAFLELTAGSEEYEAHQERRKQ